LRPGPTLGYQRLFPPPRKAAPVLFLTLYEIVGYLISIVVALVIVQFVLSLLISFNVVNLHNDFVAAIWRAVNVILEPILRPIRRIMPDTGSIDLSPMVLIIGLTILQIVLRNLAYAAMSA
jgi:YggT family protein